MHALKHWPLSLISSSFRTRLSMVLLSFPPCLILYSLLFPATHNGTILAIPIILASWLFKYRGLLISVISTILAVLLLNSIVLQTIFWQRPVLFISFIGLLSGALIGLVVSLLRHAVDMVEASRRQVIQAERESILAVERQQDAQEAERRIAYAYEQQRELNQQKDFFLAHINHELCTPLVTVSGYLELFLAYYERLDEEKKISYVHKALNSAQELNQLVTNLLDTAQLTTCNPSPLCKQISLVQVIQEVLSTWNPRDLQDFTFLVEIPDTLTVWTDQRFLLHILRNLFSNACKYAPRHTIVRIYATYNESEKSREVCLSVQDEGKGIPPAQASLLFERFVRLPQDITGTVRGTGLGLYISKQFVEALGGRIWVESSGQPGEGSCFCLTLPAVQPEPVLCPQ